MKKIKNPWINLCDGGYNCFGCAPWNAAGLKLEFYEDGDDVATFWKPGRDYQGWLDTVHGGILATLLDETAEWCLNRKLQTSGVTTSLNIRYRRPVHIEGNDKVEVRVRLREMRRNLAVLDGEIISGGEVCTTAEIVYFTVPPEKAAKDFYFTGCELED